MNEKAKTAASPTPPHPYPPPLSLLRPSQQQDHDNPSSRDSQAHRSSEGYGLFLAAPSRIIRLWDTYLSESPRSTGFSTFHVYFATAFLLRFSSDLVGRPFDEIFKFLQEVPTGEWGDDEVGVLCSQGFVLQSLYAESEAHRNRDDETE